mgnify:CR=1 FL=1
MTGFRPISQPAGDSVRPCCGDRKKASPHFTDEDAFLKTVFCPKAPAPAEPGRVSGAEAQIVNWTAQKAA